MGRRAGSDSGGPADGHDSRGPPPAAGSLQPQGPNAIYVGTPSKPPEYWLGVECLPVPAVLRAHLSVPEKQGLLVAGVAKNSPAAAAGLARYDILLRAGDKPLAQPRDLIDAVEAAKTSKLKLDVIRGGKPKTIEATPAKRPEQLGNAPVRVPDQADWDAVQGWLEGMMPGQEAGGVGRTSCFARSAPARSFRRTCSSASRCRPI